MPPPGGEPHGLPSDIAAFAVGEQPGASDSPEISAEVSETGALEIIVNILAGLEQADEYQITLASDESMSDIITQRM